VADLWNLKPAVPREASIFLIAAGLLQRHPVFLVMNVGDALEVKQ
jgi:hypothetical protein